MRWLVVAFVVFAGLGLAETHREETGAPPENLQPPPVVLPEHLANAILFAQRDFYYAAQRMALAEVAMIEAAHRTPQGLKYHVRKDEAAQRAETMEQYQTQARVFCEALGRVYDAEAVACSVPPKPAVARLMGK